MEHDVEVNVDGITSAELDEVLDEAETLDIARPDGLTEMRLYVAVDADTFERLEQRAARDGVGVAEEASMAMRKGVRVA